MKMDEIRRESRAFETARRFASVLVVTLLGLLATSGTASADVAMQLDPFDEAGSAGVDILDLGRVTVVIFGSDHLNPKDVEKETLRLGSRDSMRAQPKSFPQRLQDVDGDGFKDRLAVFDLSETGLQADRHIDAVLTGSLRDGTAFVAYDSVVTDSDPFSSCLGVLADFALIGMRCSYSTSLIALDLPALVTEINDELSPDNLKVDDSTFVVVEAWGGAGHDGRPETCSIASSQNHAKGGDGGSGGYAGTAITVSHLKALLDRGTDLYLLVGENGPGDQHGGSSSLVTGELNVLVSPVVSVLVIAGGGGGGGKGSCIEGNVVTAAGYHGGAGAVAPISTYGNVSVAGADGATAHKGQGGNQDGLGSGGPATAGGSGSRGAAGTDGIGGNGSLDWAVWTESFFNEATFYDGVTGKGGEGGKDEHAGGGGGGFGGGGGGRAEDNKGGGGGGGGWARQSQTNIVLVPFVNVLVLGSSY